MFLEHELYYGMGTGALVIICSGNTNVRNGGTVYQPLAAAAAATTTTTTTTTTATTTTRCASHM